MTTLPTLTPCPKPDCRAPITHWHYEDGAVVACRFALYGKPCPHNDDDAPDIRCYAPRATPAPLHLPDRETLAKAIYGSDYTLPEWYDESEGFRDVYRANAQAALDLIAAHQPVWRDIDPADITVGDRVRLVTAQGDESIYTVTWRDQDWINGHDETRDVRFPHTWYIDLRTVPAEPEDPRLAVVVEWSNESAADTREEAARDLLARLDAMGGESA